MSVSIRAPYTKFFWWFLRHIETFLDHIGGVDTPVGRVLVTKLGQVEKIHEGVWRSISQLLLGTHAPHIWRLLSHIDTFLDNWEVWTHLWAECQCPNTSLS